MLTTLTSITAHAAMQQVLLKTSPKIDSNFQITEEAKIEADQYRSIVSRLGLSDGQGIKEWKATRNVAGGNRKAPVEVEMTEEDRNVIIALLEKDIAEKEEVLTYHRQMNSGSNVVATFQFLVDVLKDAVHELSQKTIQE